MLKKIVITLGIILFVIIAAAAIIPMVFKKEIVSKIKSSINDQLTAKVDFKEFDLGLISSFPNLGIKLNNLTVVGTDSFATDTLANIKQLQLNLNLMSVINGGTYEINSVNLDEPTVYAKVLKSGKANWDIMKPDTLAANIDTTQTSFKAALQKYSIENGNITYDDA